MAEKMSPCPFCNHAGPFDQWPCEWLDATEVNVIRCPMCHGAAPAATWNRRHLAQPAQAVDAQTIADAVDPLVIRLHDVTAKLEAANALLYKARPLADVESAEGLQWMLDARAHLQGAGDD